MSDYRASGNGGSCGKDRPCSAYPSIRVNPTAADEHRSLDVCRDLLRTWYITVAKERLVSFEAGLSPSARRDSVPAVCADLPHKRVRKSGMPNIIEGLVGQVSHGG